MRSNRSSQTRYAPLSLCLPPFHPLPIHGTDPTDGVTERRLLARHRQPDHAGDDPRARGVRRCEEGGGTVWAGARDRTGEGVGAVSLFFFFSKALCLVRERYGDGRVGLEGSSHGQGISVQ